MKEPSAEWTPEERLAVIAAITEELQKRRPSLAAQLDRILFTAVMPAGFLENNRDQIIKGQYKGQYKSQ